jgi:hypothetical protein
MLKSKRFGVVMKLIYVWEPTLNGDRERLGYIANVT